MYTPPSLRVNLIDESVAELTGRLQKKEGSGETTYVYHVQSRRSLLATQILSLSSMTAAAAAMPVSR